MVTRIDRGASRGLLQNGTITLAVMFVMTACSYAFQLIMARGLTPEGFGELNAIVAALNVITIPLFGSALGITRAVASTGAKMRLEASPLVRRTGDRIGLYSLLVAALLLLASPIAAGFLHLGSPTPIGLLAILVMVSTALGLSRAVLVGRQRFVAFGCNQVAEALGRLVFGVVLVAYGFAQNGALTGYALGMAVAFLPIAHYFPWATRTPCFRRGLATRLAGALRWAASRQRAQSDITGAATLITGAVLVMLSGDLVLVKHFFPPAVAGEYAALSTLGKVLFLVVSAFDTVLFPAAASAQSDGGGASGLLVVALGSVAITVGPILAAYWLVPMPLVAMMFGDRYVDVVPLLGRYGLAVLLIALATLIAKYWLALGRTTALFPLLCLAAAEVVALSVLHDSLDQVIDVLLWIGGGALATSIIAGLRFRAPGVRVAGRLSAPPEQ